MPNTAKKPNEPNRLGDCPKCGTRMIVRRTMSLGTATIHRRRECPNPECLEWIETSERIIDRRKSNCDDNHPD